MTSMVFAQDIHITQNTTWSTNQQVNGNLYIDNGILTITNGVELDFVNSTTNRIIIAPNAVLKAFGVKFFSSTGRWWGITMDGLGNEYHQLYQQNGLKQPKAILSSCEVKNAQVCISNHKLGDPNTKTGGYIIASKTKFYDFLYIGIDFGHYRYLNQNGGIVNDYSRIYQCEFYATTNANTVGINLMEVQNVIMSGNVFIRKGSSELGFIGIRAIKSGIIVKAYQTLLNPNIKIPNTFINCQKGIYISSLSSLQSKSIIRDNVFTNDKDGGIRVAIEAISTPNLEIYSNEINIGKPKNTLGPCEQFGIHLTGCTGFKIEGNIITAVDLDPGKKVPTGTFGILINNSGGQSNEIYRNEIIGCHCNIQAINKNRGLALPNGANDKGLRFFCNTLSTANLMENFYISAEIVPVNDNNISDPTYGVAKNQAGALLNSPTSPTFNTMIDRTLPTGSEKDFFNMHQSVNAFSDLRDVFYMEPHDFVGNTWHYLEYYTGNNNNVGIPNHVWPQDHPSISTATPHCESRVPSSSPNISVLLTDMNDAKMNFNANLSNFNSYANNGNHGYMLLEANSIDPSNYIWIYYDMLAYHPSTDVLSIVASKEDMPAAFLTDILVANSYGIKDNRVRIAVENRIDQLSSSQMNDILTAGESISYFEELQLNISYYDNSYRRNFKDAYNYYYGNDSLITDVANIIGLLSNDDDFQSTVSLLMYYYEIKDQTNIDYYKNKLKQITIDNFENEDARSLFEILDFVYLNHNGDFQQLDPGQIDQLRELSEHRTVASGIAISILDIYFNQPYSMLWADLSNSSLRRPSPSAGRNESKIAFNIYPNPAQNIINIEVNEVSDNMQIRIVDVMGKTIQSSSLSKNISKLDVETLSNGIYNVIIESSGSILHSTKIVINK